MFHGAAIHSGLPYGLASTWQSSLLVAQTGAIPLMNRNTVCMPSTYQGKMFLIQGSRDQVMNPRHYFTLKQDYFANTATQKKMVAPRLDTYGYIREYFYRDNELKGQGVFVIGMNHEWSGADPINPIGPRGPDVSAMIVQFFLND
jgi:hypothetical protein